ncbi:MAG: hypothetical protein ACR2PO_07550 [Methyloligellaceae bacterium]
MAILRSVDGRLYDVPDDQLTDYEVPADKVNELMSEMGEGEAGGGGVEPYGWGRYRRRRYYWRNCWRNYWRNCY